MSAPPVIGIDPSLTATGIATADALLTVTETKGYHGDQRLERIYLAVITHATGCELAVVEDLPTHAQGAGKTGMAQGVVRLVLVMQEVPYVVVTAATLKTFATGKGNATKPDMRMALYQRMGLDIRDDNQVDAWWLRALGCHLLGAPLLDLPKTHLRALVKVDLGAQVPVPDDHSEVDPWTSCLHPDGWTRRGSGDDAWDECWLCGKTREAVYE